MKRRCRRRSHGAVVATLSVIASLALLSVIASLAPSGAPLLEPSVAAAATARASQPEIERQVMCVVCGVPLNVADSPQAQREKALIAGLIARGEDTVQIKRALVDQYGPGVLAMPGHHGFDAAAYVVPLGVVALLVAALLVLLPRWRRRSTGWPGSGGSAGGDARELDPSEAARLEADLARFD